MAEQLDLFVIDGGRSNGNMPPSGDSLKCYKTEFKACNFFTWEELFSGYNTLRAITFSYELGFIDKIMKYFDYAEIILGANFSVLRDENLANINMASYKFADERAVADLISQYPNLMKMCEEKNLIFRTTSGAVDHRKMYLLSSDDDMHTRVIIPSANMSISAWNNSHDECFTYDETPAGFAAFHADFDTAWDGCIDIPFEILSAKETDDLFAKCATLKKIKESGEKAKIFVCKPDEKHIDDFVDSCKARYIVDCKRLGEEFNIFFSKKKPNKNGFYEFSPEYINKVEVQKKDELQKLRDKIHSKKDSDVNIIEENYPKLVFDYDEKKVSLNDILLDLSPDIENVKKDIKELLAIFQNYDQFIGNVSKMRESHFRTLNAVFASPFCAKLRHVAYIHNKSTYSLPLYLLTVSKNASCGKTFLVSAIFKMMTGKIINGCKATEAKLKKNGSKREFIEAIQRNCKGIPFFIDEIDGHFDRDLGSFIKSVDSCEKTKNVTQPMIIFASNKVLEPSEDIRKRLVFNRVYGGLPSDADQNAYNSMGNSILERLGTSFYKKYLGYMMEEVTKEIEKYNSQKIQDEYYTDLMKISSNVIIRILKECDIAIPEYIKTLSWFDDYGENAKFIANDIMDELRDIIKTEPQKVSTSGGKITFLLEKEKSKEVRSWGNSLPSEFESKVATQSDGSIKITMKLDVFKKRSGVKGVDLLLKNFYSLWK